MQRKKEKRSGIELLPAQFFEKIELNKVLEIIQAFCKGEEGVQYFKNIKPFHTVKDIRISLARAKSYFHSFQQDHIIPNGEYFDISHDLFLLSKENYLLEIESLFRINASIRLGDELLNFLDKHREDYPPLYDISRHVSYEPSLVKLIDQVIDEEGNVRPNASPELLKITKRIQSKMRELDKEFSVVVKYYAERNMLTENAESYRNGRRVLSVPAENKRQIEGVIQDESATGKTVFIEPESLVKLNQDLYNLENERKQEINRILRQLCSDLRIYLPFIKDYHSLIVKLDIIAASAKWARIIEGQFPEIQTKPGIHFKDAFHPLLKYKNDQEDKKTISFDIEFHGPNRILLLSGPNAGGKSILMKAGILLQTMIQCGLPVPMHPDSKPGFFKKFMADIGDQQSIENDLSTYSSRLKIMAEALAGADSNTFIVIDEFGSGTDPKFGGALAESMLYNFNKKGVYGIVTTHYSNLKIFAYKTKGIVNGAMIFNQEKLAPTYEMRIGKPGSSFALEIADNAGIPKSVMKYARFKTGRNETQVEDLLINLQREKAEIEQKMEVLLKKEDDLQRLMSTYEQLHKELDVRRRRLKMEAKEKDLRDSTEQNKAFENLIRELREEKKIEEAKEHAAKLKADRERIANQLGDLESGIVAQIDFDYKSLKEGDYVRIGGNEEVGQISWIRKNKAEVRFGNLGITAKLKDLRPAKEPIETARGRSVRSSIAISTQTPTKLDIRGMSKPDAIRITEEFFDKAMLTNVHELTIIHGIGNGILRKEVKRIAREYKDIKELYHPEYESGGEGVTIIKM